MIKFLLLNCKIKKQFIPVTFLCLSAISVHAQELTWTWQNPFPSGNSHSDVAWIDDQTLYVSGTKGQFLRSADFGTTWETSNIPTTARVREIHFINANKGWAATNEGEIWHTTDRGTTWDAAI